MDKQSQPDSGILEFSNYSRVLIIVKEKSKKTDLKLQILSQASKPIHKINDTEN